MQQLFLSSSAELYTTPIGKSSDIFPKIPKTTFSLQPKTSKMYIKRYTKKRYFLYSKKYTKCSFLKNWTISIFQKIPEMYINHYTKSDNVYKSLYKIRWLLFD